MSITQETKDEIQSFLNTFFKIYPTAKKTELLYYMNGKDIKEINKDYVFSEIKQINYAKLEKGVKINVIAVYLDKETKAVLPFIYSLSLEKTKRTWVIIDGV